MPIYEYKCSKCGVFEYNQSIKDDPLGRCPTCRRKVKRLISLNNFHLKGSGWYVTDYARKSGASCGGNGKTAHKSTEKKEEKHTVTEATEKAKTTTQSSAEKT